MDQVPRFLVSAALSAALVLNAAAALPNPQVTSGAVVAPGGKVPDQTLLVKGAWPSASDASTPLPEGGRWGERRYQNDYLGLTLQFSARWQAGLEGPPPSDSGAYTLAQIVPADSFRRDKPGHLLITAQDMFFTATQGDSALELVNFSSDHLDHAVYRVEEAPRETLLGQYSFVRFGYHSLIAGMHWTVYATEVRCHVVEFIFVSTNPLRMADLLTSMSSIRLPSTAGVHAGTGGAGAPLCIKDYASADNILERVEPLPTEPRYNTIPVRIIIDRQGKVRHIHFLRAFPDQAKAITDALLRWRFKPHLLDGKPVEVETGIVFGRKTPAVAPAASIVHPGVSGAPAPASGS
jgi:hypothetical protein